MKNPSAIGLAVLISVGVGSPAVAQDQTSNQAAQEGYQQKVEDYQAQRATYEAQMQRYEEQRRDYLAQRATYDAQYGQGAYERNHGPPPEFQLSWREDWCRERQTTGAVAGGVLGALAGAVIGSNIAGRGDREGGAVLGGVAGGAIGAGVGASAARCDPHGYYYSYEQTFPYREGPWEEGRYSGRYDGAYYRKHDCRLAIARGRWDDRDEYRYVRVCPDSDGRFRFRD